MTEPLPFSKRIDVFSSGLQTAPQPTRPVEDAAADCAEGQQSDVIVLGAGIAGLAAADTLSLAGYTVTVIDQSAQCGGIHRSRQIGPYTFDVGSIFYEDAARLFNLAPGLKELTLTVRRVQRRISPTGQLLHYPIEPRDLLRWPRGVLVRALWDMLRFRLLTRTDGTLESVCLKRLGPTIFDMTGLKNYITRFHHLPPSELDQEFFFRRMGFIEKATRTSAMLQAVWRILRRKTSHRGPPAPLRIRPAEGYSMLFDMVKARLEAQGVRFVLSQPLTAIERNPAGLTVTTPGEIHLADMVVATIPIDTLYRAMFAQPAGLRSLNLLTLFVSASHLDAAAGNVLFNFHGQGRWKRITVYSRLYPDPAMPREFFAAEVTLPPNWNPDPEAAFSDLRDHLEHLGIATDLILEGHEVVENSYPLYLPGYDTILSQRIEALQDQGIVLAGRQGRFEYLPTSSGVIRRVAEELAATTLLPPTQA
jgi:protoporphyrinogen oxidase